MKNKLIKLAQISPIILSRPKTVLFDKNMSDFPAALEHEIMHAIVDLTYYKNNPKLILQMIALQGFTQKTKRTIRFGGFSMGERIVPAYIDVAATMAPAVFMKREDTRALQDDLDWIEHTKKATLEKAVAYLRRNKPRIEETLRKEKVYTKAHRASKDNIKTYKAAVIALWAGPDRHIHAIDLFPSIQADALIQQNLLESNVLNAEDMLFSLKKHLLKSIRR